MHKNKLRKKYAKFLLIEFIDLLFVYKQKTVCISAAAADSLLIYQQSGQYFVANLRQPLCRRLQLWESAHFKMHEMTLVIARVRSTEHNPAIEQKSKRANMVRI
jgi:hypothetical protein